MVVEDGDLVYHPTPRSVRATRPALKVRNAYLGYILRISELEREYFILQNTDQWAGRITKPTYMRTRTGSEMTG